MKTFTMPKVDVDICRTCSREYAIDYFWHEEGFCETCANDGKERVKAQTPRAMFDCA